MSKVEAYRCDECGMIAEVNSIFGIKAEPSLFVDGGETYRMVPPGKTGAHVCSLCARSKAINPAEKLVSRKKEGEEPYKAKLHELTVSLMRSAIMKYRAKKH